MPCFEDDQRRWGNVRLLAIARQVAAAPNDVRLR
jgi:hypothetical protein